MEMARSAFRRAVASWNVFNGPFTLIDKQSAGAVTGTFATVTNNLIFLDPTLNYAGGDGNDVTLQLARNDLKFAGVGITPNQVATGTAVDTLPNTSPIWRAVALSTSQDTVRHGFDQLSGEVHASATSMLIEDSGFVRDAANDRIRAAFGGEGIKSLPVMAYGEGDPSLLLPIPTALPPGAAPMAPGADTAATATPPG